MLVEPGVVPSAGVRAGRRPGRVPRQGTGLDGKGETVAAGQADGAARAGRAAPSRALGTRTNRAHHHALLPPHHAPAVGQAAGPPGHAQRRPAEVPRRLCRGRQGARPPGGRVPREAVRAKTPRHVALRGLGLPGRGAGHRRGRRPMDRHRRGDPLLLDRRLGFARRQRVSPQPRDALSPLAGGGTRPVVADRFPRPRHERPDRLSLSALCARPRGRRFRGQTGGHRQRHRGQRRPPAHLGEHYSRRRELLGILSERRRGVPPRRLSAGGRAPANHARADGRLPRPLPGHRPDRPPLSRQLDPAQLRHLDRPSRVQSGLGPAARDAAVPDRLEIAQIEAGRENGLGLEGVDDRRRQRLVLVVRRQPQQRPERPVRPALPQTPAKRLPGPRRAAPDRIGRAPSARGPASGTCTPSRRGCSASRWTGGRPISSGSTRATTFAAGRGEA